MDAPSPYQPPQAPIVDAPPTDAPLFRINGIGIATVLGSVAAGGWLIALNYQALGLPRQALKAKVFALLSLIPLLLLSALTPEQVPGVVFVIPQVLATVYLARSLQGEAIAARIAAGGPMRSNWRAAGIALLILLMLLLAIAVVGAAIVFVGSPLIDGLGV